jgi:hypothetical protein
MIGGMEPEVTVSKAETEHQVKFFFQQIPAKQKAMVCDCPARG